MNRSHLQLRCLDFRFRAQFILFLLKSREFSPNAALKVYLNRGVWFAITSARAKKDLSKPVDTNRLDPFA